jgi:hypothetical protein
MLKQELCFEMEYVRFLYSLRGRDLPKHIFYKNGTLIKKHL